MRYSTNLEVLKLLLDQRVDINAKNNRNQTPLQTAIEAPNLKAIDLLLKYGATITKADIQTLITVLRTNGVFN
jgi:ankyrin repeat protein